MTALAVAIVVASSPGQLPEWRLQTEIAIGSEASEEYAFTRIGVVAPVSDGSAIVADWADDRLRVFDRQGRFLRWIGRTGNGPGEFRRVNAIALRGDTLEVLERRRIHQFTLEGELLTTRPIDYDVSENYRMGTLLARTPAGHFLTVPGLLGDALISGHETQQPVLQIARDGSRRATAGVMDLNTLGVIVRFPDGRRTHKSPLPLYEASYSIGPAGDRLAFVLQTVPESGSPSEFRIAVVDPDGDTLSQSTIAYQPTRIPENERDSIAAALIRPPQPIRPLPAEERRAIQEQVPVPEYYPAVAGIVIGSDGRLWLRRFSATGSEWLVLDDRCRPIGVVRGGPTLRIHAASSTHVWASELDEFDVPRLLRLRINVPQGDDDASDEGTVR